MYLTTIYLGVFLNSTYFCHTIFFKKKYCFDLFNENIKLSVLDKFCAVSFN